MLAQAMTSAQEARLQMIQPLLDCDDCISDKSLRYRMTAEAAPMNQTNSRRILCLYYRYLATGRVTAKKRTKNATQSNQMIDRAIRQYYFGAKRLSLRAVYEMMLLDDYPITIQNYAWRKIQGCVTNGILNSIGYTSL